MNVLVHLNTIKLKAVALKASDIVFIFALCIHSFWEVLYLGLSVFGIIVLKGLSRVRVGKGKASI